jgi:hypothetical protein
MERNTLISQDSELKATLQQRGKNLSAVGLRDLQRYYTLLNHELLEITLTPDEASLICRVLKDYRFEDDPERARTIAQQLAHELQEQHLAQQSSINGENLIRKLQGLSNLGAIALVDAVERYWVRAQSNPDESLETKLLRVGLSKCCDSAM